MIEITYESQLQAATHLFAGTGWKVTIKHVGNVFTVEVTAGNMKYLAHGADPLEAAKKVAIDAGVMPAD